VTGTPPERRVRVLVVAASNAEVIILRRLLLQATASTWQVEHAASLNTASDRMAAERFHVALVDAALAPGDPERLLGRLHRTAHGPPILLLAGCVDETWARRAVQSGAEDVLERGAFDAARLVRAIDAAMARRRRTAHERDTARQLDTRLAASDSWRRSLERALHTSADALLLTERARPGAVVWANRAFERVAGPVTAGATSWFDDLVADPDRDALLDAVRASVATDRVVRHARRGGPTRDLHVALTPADAEGLVLVTARDVTHTVRAERAATLAREVIAHGLDAPAHAVVRDAVTGLQQVIGGVCGCVPRDMGPPVVAGDATHALDTLVRDFVDRSDGAVGTLLERPLDLVRDRALRHAGFASAWLWHTGSVGVLVALRTGASPAPSIDRDAFTNVAGLLAWIGERAGA